MVVALAPSLPEPSTLEAFLRDAIGRAPAGSGPCPPRLREALEHAVFPGGARVRPRLCLAVARACGAGDEPVAMAAAAAVELLHCATLVHDDLPCFDDAELRRGRPTVYRAYGESMAVLVGDGLIVLSFDVLSRALASRPEIGMAPLIALLAAAGTRGGLVAGQAWELEPDGEIDVAAYHKAKTASLFEASAVLGALVARADAAPFARLGRALGMLYQLADDISDRVADVRELGKNPGRDEALGRPTAAADLEAAQARLRLAMVRALGAVPPCPGQEELRAAVAGVLDQLAARCRVDRRAALEVVGRSP